MEFEEREREKNKKPVESSQNLPMAVLIVLVGVVCLLLYVGWEMISDEPSKVSDISPTLVETTTPIEENIQEEEVAAEISDISLPKATTANKTAEPNKKAEENKQKTKSQEPLQTGSNISHQVVKGETFYSIANRYNLSTETLASYNKEVDPKNIKEDETKLIIPVKAVHTVGPGDILRVVGSKYKVTVKQLMTANGKTKNYAKRGEKLIIPFPTRK